MQLETPLTQNVTYCRKCESFRLNRFWGLFATILLLFFIGGLEESTAQQARDPRFLQTDARAMYITRIRLDSIPFTDAEGKPWDEDGSPPDIYFRIIGSKGVDIVSTRLCRFNDADTTVFPLIWDLETTPQHRFTIFDKPFILAFYDADRDDGISDDFSYNDQLMLHFKIMPHTILAQGNKPIRHRLRGRGYSVTLFLHWE